MSGRDFYPDSLAARYTPGDPYQPSNGTEGEYFMAAWCDRCTKDLHAPEGGGCPILLATMTYRIDDDNYPPEWVHDERGHPCCTAFDPIEAGPP